MKRSDKKRHTKKKIPKDLSETQVIEIIESQPKEIQETVAKTLVAEHISYHGPLPPPELLVKFDDVIPNGAERIMAMAERQALHRQEIEKAVVIANNRDSLLGVIFAGSIGIGATFGSIWLISIGRNVTGIGMFIGAIATLAGVYIKGLQKDKKDLDEKR